MSDVDTNILITVISNESGGKATPIRPDYRWPRCRLMVDISHCGPIKTGLGSRWQVREAIITHHSPPLTAG